MQLFYNPNIDRSTENFTFSEEESKHIIRVLRKKEGNILTITNGKGLLVTSKITIANPKKCTAVILTSIEKEPSTSWIHLAVAPTKNNDRFEWFLEKATEIGINEITPILCENSERKIIKQERMEKVIQSAMKQSLQTFLPKFNPIISYKDFLKKEHKGQLFIAHCEETEKIDLSKKAVPNKNTTVLIGPEGDFSSTEIKTAFENKFSPVSLGENRLRTETAAIVACTTLSILNHG
ncbi:16S rRNA (uracil1498-N3)-methyltransferase [Maribacter vaceletii]|uniref:Ribosomal RNA small subunit methyltransferase E n=1 Tax=Maribacter vaceletii TaxID=1206816 RepID=A0A495DSL3_9FLAO|nr:16S rRNA (uracil(1498)-N(3))-methyltransferase [Maribacter vaceletii]RKR07149.1 16S rRNA (uracil1498-N3)-methyltransferase [Maribacter vaceletii]